MKRLAAVVAFLLLVAPVSAAGSNPLLLVLPTGGEGQNPIEQQSDFPWHPGPLDCTADVRCVVNTTGCRWDVDDHWQELQVDRYLDPGTTSMSPCVVSDAGSNYRSINGDAEWWSGFHGRIGVSIIAPSDGLLVSVSYAPQGRTFQLLPVPSGHNFMYTFCGNAVYSAGDPALVPITGSGVGADHTDGIGVVTTVTISVTNPTSHRVRSIQADVELVGVNDATAAPCAGFSQVSPAHTAYPFAWSP